MEAAYDVVVVGAGNAALCAALAARDEGARVLMLERASKAERGGNSTFTGGAMRVAYRGVEDIRTLVPDLTEEQVAATDFGSYPEEQFFDDLARMSQNRADPDLIEIIASRSFETLRWMTTKGIRFIPIYGRQAYNINGRFTFWGGLTVEVVGGGRGLVDSLFKAAESAGAEVWYNARAMHLETDRGYVCGVRLLLDGRETRVHAGSVVLACGGFESNVEWRTRYLGPGWDLAKVRGTRYNTGDGIRMALDVGATPWGHWSGAHAVGWEFNAPPYGDLTVGDSFQKHSYPLSIMVNAHGERFLDEGADFRNYTYARYGQLILEQPGQFAWQIFDRRIQPYLRDEYRIRQVTKVTADSLPELAERLDDVNPRRFLQTVNEYNAAVSDEHPFNPNIKDGRRTFGLAIDKTNWAQRIDEPPFEAYRVTCGITFTFGGIRISTDAEVLDDTGEPIPGLYACGELVGGIFYFNYPGGSGLTNGSVFGRIAGAQAARVAIGREHAPAV